MAEMESRINAEFVLTEDHEQVMMSTPEARGW
jgi:hypothetical protein